ncbi:MAG TPA: hypothetical protein VFU86_09105, partial [Terriglobales bacterium]|nr:hypothetical protein [Terriglobales bacterium]
MPTQGFSRKSRIGITDSDITRPPFPDFIGNWPAAHGLERPNYLQNAAAAACSEIQREHPRLFQVVQDGQMAGSKVDNVNEVADS